MEIRIGESRHGWRVRFIPDTSDKVCGFIPGEGEVIVYDPSHTSYVKPGTNELLPAHGKHYASRVAELASTAFRDGSGGGVKVIRRMYLRPGMAELLERIG